MKRIASISFLFLLSFATAMAQNITVKSQLERTYDNVIFLKDARPDYYEVKRDGKVGIADANGRIIIPIQFDKREYSVNKSKTPLFFMFSGNSFSYYDHTGRELIKHGRYSDIVYYSNINYLSVVLNGKKGICDMEGNEIIPPIFDSIHHFYPPESFSVYRNGKMGLIDMKGKEIVPPIYDKIIGGKELTCYKNGKVGVLSLEGLRLLPEIFDSVRMTDDYKYIRGYTDGRSGFFRHTDGKEIIPRNSFIKKAYYSNSNSFVVQSNDSLWGVCDSMGRLIVPAKYKHIFSDGFHYYASSVYSNRPNTVFSLDGATVIPSGRYYTIGYRAHKDRYPYFYVYDSLTNGIYSGVCDSTGKEIVPPKYYGISRLMDENSRIFFGVSVVSNSNPSVGLYNSQGKMVVDAIYEKIGIYIRENLCMCEKNGKCGFVSTENGRVVVDFQYDSASCFVDGVAKVYKDGKMSLLNNPLRNSSMTTSQTITKGRAISTFPAADSEVDKNIPNGKKVDGNTFAFIIANENYPVAKVPYALNDGWMFEKYCKQALGIKEENVHLFEDATGGNIMACVEQMKQVAKAAGGNATLIFYYAGHAFPDEEKSTAYLLPVDGDSKNPATGYSLEKLYKELNSVQTKQVVCFLDACFSGATRDDQMLIAGRGVAIKVKDEIPQGNMVVMTSATGAETAHSFEEMHHGLFTYYLLEKLQQTGGDVTLGELSEHVTKMVKRKSVLINQKKQTPTVIPSPQQQGTWQSIKL